MLAHSFQHQYFKKYRTHEDEGREQMQRDQNDVIHDGRRSTATSTAALGTRGGSGRIIFGGKPVPQKGGRWIPDDRMVGRRFCGGRRYPTQLGVWQGRPPGCISFSPSTEL